ncbi:Stp1/IreP family PP2C-type Ser/Thr phosphatase [Streptococcus sciuri]|uniref:Stp1/IreP family PP2C-type Ser/Thr phosphatase n=1 Tax=Streptococcus sciuri TaxID=2973939 RepID=A0ABT2F8R8_9STRE|nr:Stp1/IreP family PP2C-type Ser/Thr phosphatase [Streptococcus sciuri]MCS4488593.1 Stp1/IreP family PP2C-type Ser/Thr phosphatase [Streptococcus sciuri]
MELSLLTDVGQRRTSNQDYVSHFENKKGVTLVVLADGMGGHRAGNVASEITVLDLGRLWSKTHLIELVDIRDWLINVVEEENQKIHDMGRQEEYRGMGTTVEAVAIVDNNIIFAHVGDSRIGLVRGSDYHLLTSDHSLVNALVKAGEITEEEAEVHPQKNIITQSIGQANPVEPDLATHVLEAGDYLVINSDGLTNMISKEDITTILAKDMSLDDKSRALVALANERGGLDNISVALVHFESEAST